MVPDCLKLQPDSLSGGQKALYLRVASDLVKLCLVLSGVIVSCLVFNGRLSSCYFSYVVRPCLVLSCVLLHTNPFHYTFFIMTYLSHTSVSRVVTMAMPRDTGSIDTGSTTAPIDRSHCCHVNPHILHVHLHLLFYIVAIFSPTCVMDS